MKKRKAVVMLGLPASGKGTQSDKLSKRLNATIVGVGDLVREAMEKKDFDLELSKKIHDNYKKGIPQEDEVVKKLIEDKITRTSGSIIFDNYPFSDEQIVFFNYLIEKYNFAAPVILYIKINPESAINRIATRLICEKCKKIYLSGASGDACSAYGCSGRLIKRTDDTAEIMRQRIDFAQPRIEKVISFYSNAGNVYEINGEQSIEAVESEINNIAL